MSTVVLSVGPNSAMYHWLDEAHLFLKGLAMKCDGLARPVLEEVANEVAGCIGVGIGPEGKKQKRSVEGCRYY